MQLHLLKNRTPNGFVTFGTPWPRGQVLSTDFTLLSSSGLPVPVQSRITAYWPDGSVRWAAHTADAACMGDVVTLHPGGESLKTGLALTENAGGWHVKGPSFSLDIPREGNCLMTRLSADGCLRVQDATVVLSLMHREETPDAAAARTISCEAVITDRCVEDAGICEIVFRFRGCHRDGERDVMPFQVRLSVHADGSLHMDHTFFFSGNPDTDFLASMGLRFRVPLQGTSYQRHVRFVTDREIFHDCPTQLYHREKYRENDLLARQMQGETVPASAVLDQVAADVPFWNDFSLTQDSSFHYAVRKRTRHGFCSLTGMEGRRAPGTMAVSDPDGCILLGIRDFWQKCPSALSATALAGHTATLTAWFYAPDATPFDFRHYDDRSYMHGCYEGFDAVRADPNGIAVTSRCCLRALGTPVTDSALRAFSRAVQYPPVYVAQPEDYHAVSAFGPWSLSRRDTPARQWIEDQLNKAVAFYAREQDARAWYGLFDYGDFMHTYEAVRHAWRYDVGGFAWDNTELAPTYWLWLQFLRTGDETAFRLGEALCRHTADVDMYHFGPLAGFGSRHNVRHWGCSCKEPRVSMAGHHRVLYYLTGDRRIGDCMTDALQAATAFPAAPYYGTEEGMIRLRTGPDWSSLVSNYMTAYERTLDPVYREKVEHGIRGIAAAPLRLTSGPDFWFHPESGDMVYLGECNDTINMHLQACMAAPEIWIETADYLGDTQLADMVAENGLYFFLPPDKRLERSKGLVEDRRFGGVIYSGDMQAYAARAFRDPVMGRSILVSLAALLYQKYGAEGFTPVAYAENASGSAREEIPWVSTNFVAQWCLKMIVCLDLIGDLLPESLDSQ